MISDEVERRSPAVILLRRGSRWFRAALSRETSASRDDVARYSVIYGFVLKRRRRAINQLPPRHAAALRAILAELMQLYRQIGARWLARYVRSRQEPRCVLVDAIEVAAPDGARRVLQSAYGIPLCTQVDAGYLERLGCVEARVDTDEVVCTYDVAATQQRSTPLVLSDARPTQMISTVRNSMAAARPRWLVAGVGTYCASILIPSIRNAGGEVVGVCSQSEITSQVLAGIYGIPRVFSSYEAMLRSRAGECVLIATPHYLHPTQLRDALGLGYRVYCEKPVAIDEAGLTLLRPLVATDACMVGFNRRFAPAITRLMEDPQFRRCQDPKLITYAVNFGPQYNRTMSDPSIGGGKLHGACCHYLDLIEYLTGSCTETVRITGRRVGQGPGDRDNFACTLSLADGSVGTLVFSSLGQRELDVKERLIITGPGLNVNVDDFTTLRINGRCQRFFWDHFGARAAMAHFHRTVPLNASRATPTLRDGVRITELTLAMDRALLNTTTPELLHA